MSVGILARSGGPDAALTADRRHLDRTPPAASYGAVDRERPDALKVSAVAVPVAHDGRVLGCINVVFLGTALSVLEANGRYPQILRDIADRISTGLNRAVER